MFSVGVWRDGAMAVCVSGDGVNGQCVGGDGHRDYAMIRSRIGVHTIETASLVMRVTSTQKKWVVDVMIDQFVVTIAMRVRHGANAAGGTGHWEMPGGISLERIG